MEGNNAQNLMSKRFNVQTMLHSLDKRNSSHKRASALVCSKGYQLGGQAFVDINSLLFKTLEMHLGWRGSFPLVSMLKKPWPVGS